MKTISKGHRGFICAFDTDGTTVITCSNDDKFIKIWSIDSYDCLNIIKLKSSTLTVNCLKIYKESVIIGNDQGRIQVYDIEEGDLKVTIDNPNEISNGIKDVIFSSNKELIIASFDDNSISVWSCLDSYNILFKLRGHTDDIEVIPLLFLVNLYFVSLVYMFISLKVFIFI
jgi:WD40 repeat protein